MKVKEMIELLRVDEKIEFRNEDNREICITNSNSEGMAPYLERDVLEWFPYNAQLLNKANLVIILKNKIDYGLGQCFNPD